MEFIDLFLNKHAAQPLYGQLYRHLAGRIRAGELAAGEKLPGKRTAAAQLGVSVNTVDEAYQMLAAEGYVAARPRSGFVVCRLEQLVPPPGESPAQAGPAAPPREASGEAYAYSFASGGLDASLFPLKTWNRLLREVLQGGGGLFARGEVAGEGVLRGAVADYLRGYRGVRCDAGQVVIGAGLEVLFGMLARLLAGRLFALEEPGYPKAAHILRNMGVAACAVPVDESGMRPDALWQSGAAAAYLTPSHQLPTGAVMPAGRRSEMLRWADASEGTIIEDDYDSEFRFDGRPIPCMQGLDETGRVVYAGTFTRSLAPGIRAAYLVLPRRLLAAWREMYADYACTVSRPEQHTLARLMTDGHFARALNRARRVYRGRRDALAEALARELPKDGWQMENRHTGLYFVLRLPGRHATNLAARARAAGVLVRAVDEYRTHGAAGTATSDALVLGYGALGEEDIAPAAAALASVIRE